MGIGLRELRNRTSWVIDRVRSGERVTLTVRGERIADIVPHNSARAGSPVLSCETNSRIEPPIRGSTMSWPT
jgi:prevent-host-death family protein